MTSPAVTGRPTAPAAGGASPRLPALLAATVVLAQISYPLLDGPALRISTVTTVVLFALASAVHAAVTLGHRAAVAAIATAGGIGLLAEAVGVRTGHPFGQYGYTGTLGPQVLGVPVVVPLAWAMMAYPCLLLGRRLAGSLRGTARRFAVTATGAGALTGWDLYLDPQMVDAGHWQWRFPTPALPGVPGIPLTNYAGWLLVAVAVVTALDAVLPRPAGGAGAAGGHGAAGRELAPAALLAWTWLGGALANAAFFGRPGVALWGLVGMGAFVGPYLLRLRRTLREEEP